METPKSQEFFTVLRSGDPDAVDRLLNQLDPLLRRIIRLRLVDGRLRRVIDTADIMQSLLKDFLSQQQGACSEAEASAGLGAYLAAAARYKIQTRLRKERRQAGSLPDGREPVSREHLAANEIEDQDFVEAVRSRLRDDNRRLFDLTAQGLTWIEISGKVGGNPDALRMRLRRAVAAVLSTTND